MKKIVSILIITFLYLQVSALAQSNAKITCENPSVSAIVNEGVYQSHRCLVIQLKDGKIPLNIPARRLQLLSDKNNNFNSFALKQIEPGKFVTLEPVNINDSVFKLKVLNCQSIKEINISFEQSAK